MTEIQAIARAASTYELAAIIPTRPGGTSGRPAEYPIWAYIIFMQAITCTGSARKAASLLQNEIIWNLIVTEAAEYFGGDRDHVRATLPASGPRRHQWNYWSKRLHEHLPAVQAGFRELAVSQALNQGLLDPKAPFDLRNPDRKNIVSGDGKFWKSPSSHPHEVEIDAETGEIKIHPVTGQPIAHRIDPASRLGKKGGEGGTVVFGAPYTTLSCRSETSHSRVVLDVEYVEGGQGIGGGEAGLGIRMVKRLLELAPGVQQVAWDGAMRGVHINEALTAGINISSPVAAKTSVTGRSYSKTGRTAKDGRYSTETFTHPKTEAECVHRLDTQDGRLHEVHAPNIDGERVTTVLDFRVERRPDKNTCRWYHVVRIPCVHGTTEVRGVPYHDVRIPLHAMPTDKERGFNRAENLRVNPPGTPVFQEIVGYRQDAEAVHAEGQAAFVNERLPAYGVEQQTLILLGLAMTMNARSRWRHASRERDLSPVAAA